MTSAQHEVTVGPQHVVGSTQSYYRARCTCGWRSSKARSLQGAQLQSEAHLRSVIAKEQS